MTVAEMLARMSSRELTEWMMYYQMEPFGTDVDMYGHAMTTSTLMNIYRDVKKHPSPIQPREFMPEWDKTDIVEKQIQQVRQMNAIFGGIEVTDGDDC